MVHAALRLLEETYTTVEDSGYTPTRMNFDIVLATIISDILILALKLALSQSSQATFLTMRDCCSLGAA
jgi:hypothetical protein